MWHLALGLLQQLSAAPAIVVERNKFAYYKVPVQMIEQMLISSSRSSNNWNSGNNSDLYLVLQCPPKLDDSIPKPKDMLNCNVIDEYKELWSEKVKVLKRKKNQRLHMMPFRIVIRPLNPPAMRKRKRPKREQRKKLDKNLDEIMVDSPLKHLGGPHIRQKVLKLSADHGKFKRGNSSKGFQHIYHRDEIYNDHIFYDELQTDGEYHNYLKQKILS
ncbi:uncharacterized protein Dwil_GK12939 [Drosophila willistoni]|uniref:Uncharacterized protein n=1 Tax=Drosophila willistoni TaxID=7260 RepID=B4NIJ0_DROWI|nr:uncharacterized protein LOC6650591 [Drosophila willistoni]EDW84813.1 uncharacterized protein Dwil_GK12939 [Drosophila willistoni]